MTSSIIPSITLNDGCVMPTLGISITNLNEVDTEKTILHALQAGYRLIDTAKIYGHEAAIGRAIKQSGISRSEIFLITKLAIADQGFTTATEAAHIAIENLGLDYVDLFLIHWPAPSLGLYVDSFGGLLQAKEQGLTRSIGTTNFGINHLNDVIDLVFEVPSINLVELHPLLAQSQLRQFHLEHGIITGAHTPLAQGRLLTHPVVEEIARECNCSSAQVLIRWSMQLGNVVIPRPDHLTPLESGIQSCDSTLSAEQMGLLNALDSHTRFLEDPDTFTG